mmetsp:Transcript_29203/g.85611  ORF Transcript_29203/g.85611 Transcript_29203/m.85611 type:complete len:348 (-) Transcript_29203:289-1332(-)
MAAPGPCSKAEAPRAGGRRRKSRETTPRASPSTQRARRSSTWDAGMSRAGRTSAETTDSWRDHLMAVASRQPRYLSRTRVRSSGRTLALSSSRPGCGGASTAEAASPPTSQSSRPLARPGECKFEFRHPSWLGTDADAQAAAPSLKFRSPCPSSSRAVAATASRSASRSASSPALTVRARAPGKSPPARTTTKWSPSADERAASNKRSSAGARVRPAASAVRLASEPMGRKRPGPPAPPVPGQLPQAASGRPSGTGRHAPRTSRCLATRPSSGESARRERVSITGADHRLSPTARARKGAALPSAAEGASDFAPAARSNRAMPESARAHTRCSGVKPTSSTAPTSAR